MFTQARPDFPLVQSKLAVIDFAIDHLGMEMFADLGGVWGVEGGYSFYALDRGAKSGVLVDTHPTDTVLAKARDYGDLRVMRANFGGETVATAIGAVDAVFLFDTLLHQVAPNWDDILKMYAPHARCILIYNQQWVGRGRRVRLFDLGEEEYFRNVPHDPEHAPYDGLFAKLDTPHPDHGGRLWRDVHHVWQWGITDADLMETMQNLGYSLRLFSNDGQFGQLPNFENHVFAFSR